MLNIALLGTIWMYYREHLLLNIETWASLVIHAQLDQEIVPPGGGGGKSLPEGVGSPRPIVRNFTL